MSFKCPGSAAPSAACGEMADDTKALPMVTARAISGAGLMLLAMSAEVAWSCSCVPYPDDPEQAVQRALPDADAVFVGRVLSKRRVSTHTPNDTVEVAFDVSRHWKGPATDRLYVRTASSSTACGYAFLRHRTYLIFAHKDSAHDVLVTGICSLTRAIARASRYIEGLDALASWTGDATALWEQRSALANPIAGVLAGGLIQAVTAGQYPDIAVADDNQTVIRERIAAFALDPTIEPQRRHAGNQPSPALDVC